MTLHFAILGAGRIGLVHAKTIANNPEATLAAVADANEEAATALISAYGGKPSSIDDIALSEDIDAVLVCTPTNTHA
ncbi:MAG: Gfo/Idh/MocA family oxidoreductase, partial [Paracoccaceae bacterium]